MVGTALRSSTDSGSVRICSPLVALRRCVRSSRGTALPAALRAWQNTVLIWLSGRLLPVAIAGGFFLVLLILCCSIVVKAVSLMSLTFSFSYISICACAAIAWILGAWRDGSKVEKTELGRSSAVFLNVPATHVCIALVGGPSTPLLGVEHEGGAANGGDGDVLVYVRPEDLAAFVHHGRLGKVELLRLEKLQRVETLRGRETSGVGG